MGRGQTVTDADRADKPPGHITSGFTGLTVANAQAAAEWLRSHAGFTIIHDAGETRQPDPRVIGLSFSARFVTAELCAPNGGVWWLTEFCEPHGQAIQPRVCDVGRPSLGLITTRLADDRERLRLAGVRWFPTLAAEIADGRYAGGWECYGVLSERTPIPKLGISLHQLHPTRRVT